MAAESVYTYDSLYRLVEANGRQHNALAANHDVAGAFKQSAYLNDITALTNYTQYFTYDEAGNLTKLVHDVPAYSAACYTRHVDVDTDTNRALQRPDIGDTVFTGKFDANGNQVVFAHLNGLAWNFRDNISKATIIPREDFSDDAEWYVYDASGQRVRKVREALGFAGTVLEVEEKIYLGVVEIKRFRRETTVDNVTTITYLLDRSSLHVMDDKSRIALVNYWDFDGEEREVAPANLDTNRVRYQYGNHLGSASLELDAAGLVISYEEYFPYGGTAFMTGSSQAEVKLKEYRYSGKERDDSTAFYYYGARYYAPWVCRWCSPDPAGPVDGVNLFLFVRGNPVGMKDEKGNESKPKDDNIDWDKVPFIGISETYGTTETQNGTNVGLESGDTPDDVGGQSASRECRTDDRSDLINSEISKLNEYGIKVTGIDNPGNGWVSRNVEEALGLILKMRNDDLKKLEGVTINFAYQNAGERRLGGLYQHGSRTVNLYTAMIDKNMQKLDSEAPMTIFHEMGHALSMTGLSNEKSLSEVETDLYNLSRVEGVKMPGTVYGNGYAYVLQAHFDSADGTSTKLTPQQTILGLDQVVKDAVREVFAENFANSMLRYLKLPLGK